MTGLQTATDIVALVFMGIIILYALGMLVISLMVMKKINRAVNALEDRLDSLRELPFIGRRIFNSFKKKGFR